MSVFPGGAVISRRHPLTVRLIRVPGSPRRDTVPRSSYGTRSSSVLIVAIVVGAVGVRRHLGRHRPRPGPGPGRAGRPGGAAARPPVRWSRATCRPSGSTRRCAATGWTRSTRRLRRAAYDIGYKDELIDVLEAEVAALRDGRHRGRRRAARGPRGRSSSRPARRRRQAVVADDDADADAESTPRHDAVTGRSP